MVEQIMIPKDELIAMKPNMLAEEALRRMIEENKSRVFVFEDMKTEELGERSKEYKQEREKQKLIGLISETDILNSVRQ
jgi:CBS domain-containing protein